MMKKIASRLPDLPVDIYGLSAVRLVVSLGSFVGPFLAMMLTEKLGYDKAGAGAFMSLVSLVSAAGLLLGGKLGDSFGRPRVLLSLQVATAVLLLLGAALGFSPLTPFVIAAAMGCLSGTWPIMNAIVADVAPAAKRKESFALMYWANNLGFSAGPALGGFLYDSMPRLLFVGNAVALFLAAAVVAVWVKGKPYQDASAADGAAAAADTGGAAAGSDAGETTGDGHGNIWRILAANPLLMLYGLASVLTAFIYNQHTFALPVFLKELMGDAGGRSFGLVMTTNGLTVVVMTAFVTMLAKRMSNLGAIALSSAFYVVGFGSYWFATGMPLALGVTVVWTLGEILGATSGNAFVAEHAPPAFRSRINSAISLCYIAGNTLAPLAAGAIADRFGTRTVWPVTAAMAVVAVFAFVALDRFDRRLAAGRA